MKNSLNWSKIFQCISQCTSLITNHRPLKYNMISPRARYQTVDSYFKPRADNSQNKSVIYNNIILVNMKTILRPRTSWGILALRSASIQRRTPKHTFCVREIKKNNLCLLHVHRCNSSLNTSPGYVRYSALENENNETWSSRSWAGAMFSPCSIPRLL